MRIHWVVTLMFLAACGPEEDEPPQPAGSDAACGADELQRLLGQPVTAYDFEAEGRPLRILPPGSVVTMDHRLDRLNVDVDADGAIQRIWCG